MLLMPGLWIRHRQQRQTCRTQQTVGAGQQRAEQTQTNTAEPPPRTQTQLPRHFRAVQTTQTSGDIRQQHARQPVTADDAEHPANQRQHTEFDDQAADQHPRTDPAGTQRAQQATTLLQCQTDSRVHDEQPDHEREKSQCIKIQVEALGQARQIVFLGAAFELQPAIERGRQLGVKILGQ